MKSEELTKEMSSLRQALEQAEDSRRALSQQSKREQASLERQLQTAGKNRDQLAEQVPPHSSLTLMLLSFMFTYCMSR